MMLGLEFYYVENKMLEFVITTTSDHVDDLSDQLFLIGSAAITWLDAANNPIYEPLPGEIIQWQEMKIVALFEDDSVQNNLVHFLNELKDQALITGFEQRQVPEKDWIRSNLDQFQPIKVGKRLWICPSWVTPPDTSAVNVFLDPGLAFGTGTHPTTSLCLQWLDDHIQQSDSLLDYGCGSGILAVAALKLGAKKAMGVDYDPQALEACEMNAKLNQLTSNQFQVFLPENYKHEEKYDIIMANILAQPLISLAGQFASDVKENGKVILSGILTTQAADVIKVYEDYFVFQNKVEQGEWVRLDFEKK